MDTASRSQRVRTGAGLCKTSPVRRVRWLSVVVAAAALLQGACDTLPPTRTITLSALENAPPRPASADERIMVPDAEALMRLCTPLGPRLGLLQVRSSEEWDRLAQIVPWLGHCPDLRHGILIGLACWAGTPVDGQWPIRIDSVQVTEGAGLVRACFHSGSYLPDGVAYLEIAHVKGLAAVLVVDVDGTTFYPD